MWVRVRVRVGCMWVRVGMRVEVRVGHMWVRLLLYSKKHNSVY